MRPGGGIGRHARLKIVCRKAWEFDSPPGHHERNVEFSEFASLRSATNLYSILGVKTNWRFRIFWEENFFIMKQKGFLNIFLVVIIAVILIGTGSYFVITRNKPKLSKESLNSTAQRGEVTDNNTIYDSKPPLCGEEELRNQRLTNNQIVWHLDIAPKVVSATKQAEVTFKADVGDSPSL